MFLRIIMGAIIGAVFGYVVGWLLYLIPGFNASLVSGINALTGLSGISIPALLAALGFILGIIGGLLQGISRHRRHRTRL